jgi:hypothetical protein
MVLRQLMDWGEINDPHQFAESQQATFKIRCMCLRLPGKKLCRGDPLDLAYRIHTMIHMYATLN